MAKVKRIDVDTSILEDYGISISRLRDIGMYLEGLRQGSNGNIPIGSEAIENLWRIVRYLNRLEPKE